MTWVKLDDQFFSHPKVLDLSKDQKLLYLAALAHCAANLTDGKLSRASIRIIAATVDVPPSEAAALCDAKLWEPDADGYKIHDFGDYNPRSEDVKASRESLSRIRSEAGKRGAESRWGDGKNGKPDGKDYSNSHSKPDGPCHKNDGKTDGKTMAPSESDSYPNPTPNPDQKNTEECPTDTGGKPPTVKEKVSKIFVVPTPEEVEEVFRERGYGGLNLGVKFVAHYATAGWKLNSGQKMVSWQSAVTTWIEREKEKDKRGSPATNANGYHRPGRDDGSGVDAMTRQRQIKEELLARGFK